LLAQQELHLSNEEQAFLDGPVDELCAMLHDWKITHNDHDLPPEVWAFLGQHRFFGMIIPQTYGGLGFSAECHSAVVMKLASRQVSAAVTVMVPNSLGPAELLLNYGTDEQKQRLLPRLATGEEIPCFALTAAEAGSDAAAMTDYGVVCRNEAGELGIRLNWKKRYITLAPVATLLGLAFKLYDPDGLLGGSKRVGITLALIATDTAGVTTGQRHYPMGLAFMNGPTEGHDVWISMDHIIGGVAQAGKGWAMLMACLGDGRGISLPALATGAVQKCAYCCGAYARVRKQFHVPIGRFEGVESVLASIGGHAYMMNAARHFTVQSMDRGETSTVASAIVKYHLTERMRYCVNAAMDIHGGKGISQGPNNYLGEMYRALPIGITVEGANILTRSLIIFGQGVLRCHPYLLTEMECCSHDDEASVLRFDAALFSHIGMTLSNVVRSLWLGLSHAQFTHIPVAGSESHYYQHVTRFSAALALCSDVSLLSLGSAFKRREAISARLGDAFSQLYLIAASLKYFRDHGRRKDELPLLRWACDDALYRTQQALDGVLNNLPNRPLAWLLRRIVFPWGRVFAPPPDWLVHQVAANVMEPAANLRISQGIYRPSNSDEPLALLADAWHAALLSEPIERKLEQAVREQRLTAVIGDPQAVAKEARDNAVITEEEYQLFCHSNALRARVIAVDVFNDGQFKQPVDEPVNQEVNHG
jgi:acyl-CoA dehydrogenase